VIRCLLLPYIENLIQGALGERHVYSEHAHEISVDLRERRHNRRRRATSSLGSDKEHRCACIDSVHRIDRSIREGSTMKLS